MTSNSDISQKAYAGNDAGIAMVMGELMLAHYRRVYQAFDGDLLLAMILAEIAHYNVQDLVRGGRFRNADIAAYLAENRLRPVNTLSLSQSCAIPRETLRRKIRTLTDTGLIRKNADGSLNVTEQCLARFGTDFNMALLKDIRTCAARLESLLDEDDA
jgi:hypothetical protein